MENLEGQTPIVEKKINPVKHFLAGAFGSISLVIVGHPADTLKVRETREQQLIDDCSVGSFTNDGRGSTWKKTNLQKCDRLFESDRSKRGLGLVGNRWMS